MTFRLTLLLFFLGLIASLAVAAFEHAPGYMDADYYLAGGMRLAQGNGFSEPFLWNYLDDPHQLPHPSYAYWMPLAGLVAAAGIKLSGLPGFSTARLSFILLAACVPPLAASLAYQFSKRRDTALLAGLLAVFSAFYLPFLVTTDTFGLYMVLGGLFLLAVGSDRQITFSPQFAIPLTPILLGLLAGLMHLARADGILWLFVALLSQGSGIRYQGLVISDQGSGIPLHQSLMPGHVSRFTFHASRFTFPVSRALLCLLGYLLIMGPWMGRNLAVFGTLLSPGGSRALWITDYDELFSYPASLLTLAHWWSAGLGEIIRARLWALGQNLQTALGVQGGIFLAPLILAGLWRLRHNLRVAAGVAAWLLTFLVMTFVFPYQGARGGFFHSGAAVQILFWAVAPLGLEVFTGWGERVRRWPIGQARPVFQAGLVCLALFLTLWVARGRVIGSNPGTPAWGEYAARYARLEQTITSLGARPGDVVLVNNPPGYGVATGRPAIYTPFGDEKTILAVARQFHARLLLLEYDHAQGLNGLYDRPGDRPGLVFLSEFEKTMIYRIEP